MIDFKTETLRFAVDYLESRNVENAAQEALWLFEHVFGKSETLVLSPDDDTDIKNSVARVASLKNSKRYNELLSRRANGEPLQYLLGEWEFYGYPMKVGKGVLIPRPETEFLIDIGKEYLEKKEDAVVIDLCAGTGCVGIAITKETGCRAIEIEISEEAGSYAKENISLNKIADKIEIHTGDIFNPEMIEKMPIVDCIFANPPYLSKKDMEELQREVTHEPETALYGGEDGLEFYRKIFALWKGKLKAGGLFAVEVGDGQAEAVKSFMEKEGFEVEVQKDYALIDRIVYTKFERKVKTPLILNEEIINEIKEST